jgi:putative selenium metabolism hydrolase
MGDLDARIRELARRDHALTVALLREAIRLPADFVGRRPEEGGDPRCGTSGHEKPRLEFLRRKILELGAADGPEHVGYDAFGNLWWRASDPADGIPPEEKTVVYFDGHADTVEALRGEWHEALGPGLDPYLGLTDAARVDEEALRTQLGLVPPCEAWERVVWGRGAADQLGGLVCQVVATRILRELAPLGSLRGLVVWSYATVSEEANDGGGPMYLLRHEWPGAGPERIPDVVVLTEGTGDAQRGALGIYRGQRGRMQIEVVVTGRSAHGSMPWEGLNPLEAGAAIIHEATRQAQEGRVFADDAFLGRGTRTASWARLETPSDCAVPHRFVFRFDRRLTAGEDPGEALAALERLEAVAKARAGGWKVEVRIPRQSEATWTGYVLGNPQVYPAWTTPEDDDAVRAARETYERVVAPSAGAGAPPVPREPRVGRWIFSTDGVGYVATPEELPAAAQTKGWIREGTRWHPPMVGFGPGLEQNTHKLGEWVAERELTLAVAFLARFPSLYRMRRSGARSPESR